MSIEKRIKTLSNVAAHLQSPKTNDIIALAYAKNSWFEPSFSQQSIKAICSEFLAKNKLEKWLEPYCIEDDFSLNKTVGIVCAGNVPLVGFHDFLCCYVLGIPVRLKLSSKDDVLMRYTVQTILNEDEEYAQQFSFAEQLKDFDAVIATGSASTNRYFEYYFSQYPSILRSNRTSVAVLSLHETDNDLLALAHDVFLYFGLGCRNVGKIFVPLNFEVESLFQHFSNYAWLHQHSQYMNNYDYNRTILLMNQTSHLANEFLMMQENTQLHSPIATLHVERYENIHSVKNQLAALQEQIQCVVGNFEGMIPFGKAQFPQLSDYADGKDTIGFLLSL